MQNSSATNFSDFQLAGGRDNLPRLLFVTDSKKLEEEMKSDSSNLLKLLSQKGHGVCDLNGNNHNFEGALAFFRTTLRSQSNDDLIHGIVILGNYNVVASERFFVLSDMVSRKVSTINQDSTNENDITDLDAFFVWNDDCYGKYTDKDLIPKIPVSRIPNDNSIESIIIPLQANYSQNNSISVIRNNERSYADLIFSNAMPDDGYIWTLPHQLGSKNSKPNLNSRYTYIILHGYLEQGVFFDNYKGKITINDLDNTKSDVILSACCWGALTVNRQATVMSEDRLEIRSHTNSIALRYLRNGAIAFVGCTGAHPSPPNQTYDCSSYGSRLHWHFWNSIRFGASPAQALFEAKILFALEIPKFDESIARAAFEEKVLWGFTCLGLGW